MYPLFSDIRGRPYSQKYFFYYFTDSPSGRWAYKITLAPLKLLQCFHLFDLSLLYVFTAHFRFSGVAGTTRKHNSLGLHGERGPAGPRGPPGPPGNDLTVYNEMNESISVEKRFSNLYTVVSLWTLSSNVITIPLPNR